MGSTQVRCGGYQLVWLYESTSEIDLKINKALHRAKRSIMKSSDQNLKSKVNINAAGQEAIKADVLAEKVFLQTLIDEGLSGTMYSEESGVKQFGTPEEGDVHSIVLILDPLDGSQNYLKGIPFGCISVAYGAYLSDPRLGDLTKAAIMNLYSNEEFFGEQGWGAYKNGKKLGSFKYMELDHFKERSIQISYYAYGNRAMQYAYDFKHHYSLRSLGSAAWELALVADNRNDAFADIRGVLKVHDFAAARIILNELDGEMRFLNISNHDADFLPLDQFKQGYSLIASLDLEFLEFLEDEFYAHELVPSRLT